MRVGIVGSRRRKDEQNVKALVETLLPEEDIVVSGGCKGVDTWAAVAARTLGLVVTEHFPALAGCKTRFEAVKAYYARNREIVKDSDVVVAFVSGDRKGGTENTIKHANELGVKVVVVPPGTTVTREALEREEEA